MSLTPSLAMAEVRQGAPIRRANERAKQFYYNPGNPLGDDTDTSVLFTLLRLRNEAPDAVHSSQSPVTARSATQGYKNTYNCSSSLQNQKKSSVLRNTQRGVVETHLEPAFMGTASLTFSTRVLPAAGAASFFPPVAANVMAPTAANVPSVRYSFLMARPNITLHSVLSDAAWTARESGTY